MKRVVKMAKQKMFYWKIGAEYESSYSIEESVKRLQDVTQHDRSFFCLRKGVYGKVTRDYVSLCRFVPYMRNSFKPFFVGKFQHSRGRVVLKGVYSMHIFVKVFLGVWFSMPIVSFITRVVPIFDEILNGERNISPLIRSSGALEILLFGIGLVLVGQLFSRNDIIYISKFINDNLKES